MTDSPPDRLCADPKSPYFSEDELRRGVGIRFKGRERGDVEEYCVSESWIRVPVPKTKDRRGNPLIIKLSGAVEAYYNRQEPETEPEGEAQG